MTYYYAACTTRSQAFLLERRLKNEGIPCELAYMPREVMTDLCNMGVKFHEGVLGLAANTILMSGIPGCKVYREVLYPGSSQYFEVQL